MNRREFAKVAALAAPVMMLPRVAGQVAAGNGEAGELPVHIFSKHLQFLDLRDMARAAADMGFDGVDLTVRRGGHVDPANAVRELPRAAEALREAGLAPNLFVADVTDASDAKGVAVLETAARVGFKAYRMGYLPFTAGASWRSELERHKSAFAALAKVNERLGLHGAYQNHAGNRLGAYLPDLAYLLEGCDPRWAGCQFDIRHAVVEGGTAWPQGLRWLLPHIRTVAIKDFKWDQRAGGLRVVNVPLGEGVVDFAAYFRQLRAAGVVPVVSLHCEYELGGANAGRREISIPPAAVYQAMTRDLDKLRELWRASA